MADGTEKLGDPALGDLMGNPGIEIAQGSGIIAAGTGLINKQPGTIDINIPAGATVKQALLYWEGQHIATDGDNTIEINNGAGVQIVMGALIGGPTVFWSNVKSSTYRADITNLKLIKSGSNTLEVGGLNFDYIRDGLHANNGAGILVIYDDGTRSKIMLRDGNDLAYNCLSTYHSDNFCSLLGSSISTTVEQTFTFIPSDKARNAELIMFFSSVEGILSTGDIRPSSIKITVGTNTHPPIINELRSNNGEEWDTLTLPPINIPAGVTTLKVQALSGDGINSKQPASFAWNAAALSIPLPPAPGTGTPGYWKNHPEAWPVEGITIGGKTYTKTEAIAIMAKPVKGDKTLTMFPALVSAILNRMIGNDASCIADTITAADEWMEDHEVGSIVTGSSQAWKDGGPLSIELDNYNNGLLCAPHRD